MRFDNQRLFDLARQQRMEHSAVARLEDYDAIRAQLAECRRQRAAAENTRDHYFVESERNVSTAATLQRERDELRALLRDLWEPSVGCDCDACNAIRPRVNAALAHQPSEASKKEVPGSTYYVTMCSTCGKPQPCAWVIHHDPCECAAPDPDKRHASEASKKEEGKA